MPIIGPAIDIPPPPAGRCPGATVERPWLKASYHVGLNGARGRMLARNLKGDIREYRFEVAFAGGVPRATVSVGDAPNPNNFDHSDANPGFGEITGLPEGGREDLLDFARRIGVHLRDLALERFETVA